MFLKGISSWMKLTLSFPLAAEYMMNCIISKSIFSPLVLWQTVKNRSRPSRVDKLGNFALLINENEASSRSLMVGGKACAAVIRLKGCGL